MFEFIIGTFAVATYAVPLTVAVLILRKYVEMPDELFRKLMHFVFLGAYLPFLFAFRTWWKSACLALLLIIPIYPLLMLAERIPAFSGFLTERKKGEFKNSLALALIMMFACICICWGRFNDRFLALACAYAWGIGDAFAALIGKRFGKHRIRLKFADCRKSVEGTAAMFVFSALSVFIILLFRGGPDISACAFISVVTAAICALVELFSKNGFDTVTCPAATMAVLVPLCSFFSQ